MEYQLETYKRNTSMLAVTLIIIDLIIAYLVFDFSHVLFFSDLNPTFSLLFFLIIDLLFIEWFIIFRFFELPMTVRIETKEKGIVITEGRKKPEGILYKNIFGLHTRKYLSESKYSLGISHYSSSHDMELLDSKKKTVIRVLYVLKMMAGGKFKFKNYIIKKEQAEEIEKDIVSRRESLKASVKLDPSFSNLARD